MLLLGLLAVLPVILGLGYAVLYSFGIIGSLNTGFTLSYWQQLLSGSELWVSLAYSSVISGVAIVLCILISLWIALSFHHFFARGPLSYFIYAPLAFPSVVAAFFFFQLLSGAGLLSRIFYQTGIIHSTSQFPDLVNDRFAIGIILSQTFLSCPIFILLYTNLIKSERIEGLSVLAGSLGATQNQFSLRITVPLLFRKSWPSILLYFIFKLGAYEIPLLLGRSNPQTLSVLAINKLQRFNLMDIPQGYAIAVTYTVVVLVLLHFALPKSQYHAS
jgi:putative spermidine/putrescine transport system permease protein